MYSDDSNRNMKKNDSKMETEKGTVTGIKLYNLVLDFRREAHPNSDQPRPSNKK